MDRTEKAALISAALKGIATGRFEISDLEGLQTIVIKNYPATLSDKEAAMDMHLEMLTLDPVIAEEGIEFGWEDREATWGDWHTEYLLTSILSEIRSYVPNVFGGKPTATLVEEWMRILNLRGLSYRGVIERVYDVFRSDEDPALGREIFELRERLSTEMDGSREAELLEILKNSTANVLADFLALRLGGRFPKMVERLDKLRSLPVRRHPVHPHVQQYLSDASHLYIEGHFTACLVICRAAIEFALKDVLSDKLKHELPDKLEDLIDIGKKRLSWTLNLDVAHLVRDEANRALHERPPSPDKCFQLFDATRGILRELYTTPSKGIV